MSPKILAHVPPPRSQQSRARWRRRASRPWSSRRCRGRAEPARIEYMVSYPHIPMRDPFYKAAPKLKLVQLLSAGYDNVDLEAARRAKVPLSNNGGANAISVSEHAHDADADRRSKGDLAARRRVGRTLARQRDSAAHVRAPRQDARHHRLRHDRQEGGALAQPFGMHVQYFDIARLSEDGADAHGVKFQLLHELLRTSDVVSLHVPLNDSTRHMIGKEELELMKPNAIIINTSRGPVIDEVALHATLAAGKISAPGSTCSTRAAALGRSAAQARQCRADRAFRGPTWDDHVARFATRSTMCGASRAASRRCGWCRACLNRGNPGTKIAGFCRFSVLLRPLTIH